MNPLNRGVGSLWLAVVLGAALPAIARAQFTEPTEDQEDRVTSAGQELLLDNCQVSFISEPVLAFQEAGLVRLVPEEGQQINSGDVLSELDDQDVRLQIDVAQYAFDSARLKAESDVSVRYAVADAKAKKADLDSGLDANRRKPGVVPEMELRRRRLEYDVTLLRIENSQHDLKIAAADAKVKEAELKIAHAMLQRMRLKSPITGIVTKKMRYVGEYARPGDPVVQVGQLDRLRVEGRIDFNDLPITAARGCEVEIRVGDEVFRSRIEFVDARVDTDKYVVWAEIDNRADERNEFIVRPGMIAEMRVQLEPSVARLQP